MKNKKQADRSYNAEMARVFPFYNQSRKDGGAICPLCGSRNVLDWKKSENYHGYSCGENGCELGARSSWAVDGKGKGVTLDFVDLQKEDFEHLAGR